MKFHFPPKVGMTFDNFHQLTNYMEVYSLKVSIGFTIKHSAKIENCIDLKDKVNHNLKVRNATIKCKYGSTNKMSTAKERNTRTFDHGCTALIKVKLTEDRTKLTFCFVNLDHTNHPIHSEECFHALPEQRQLPHKTKVEIKKFLSMGANIKFVKLYLADEMNIEVTNKDLYNLRAQSKSKEENTLESLCDLLINIYECNVYVLEDAKTHRFKALYFSNVKMEQSLKSWPEIVFIDGTYKLFNLNFTLFVLLAQTGSGRTEIVGTAILANEDAESLKFVAQCFHDRNLDAVSEIKCFMSDKDLTERSVFKEIFPDCKYYLCMFHTLKAMGRAVAALKLESTEEKTSRELLEKLVFSKDEKSYLKWYHQLLDEAPKSVIHYFNKNWAENKQDWSMYCMTEGNFGNYTNNYLESANKQIKSVCSRNSTLCTFVNKYFVYLKSQSQETNLRRAIEHLKRPNISNKYDELKNQYLNYLTNFAFKKLLPQLNAYKQVTIGRYNPETKECIIKSEKDTYKFNCMDCNCLFFSTMKLPCKHILAARKFFQLPLFEHKLCHRKWSKEYDLQQSNMMSPIDQDTVKYKCSNQVTPVVVKVIGKRPKSKAERCRGLQPYATEIVSLGSNLVGEDFDHLTNQLDLIITGLRRGYVGHLGSVDCNVTNSRETETTQSTPLGKVVLPPSTIIKGRQKGMEKTTSGYYPRKKRHDPESTKNLSNSFERISIKSKDKSETEQSDKNDNHSNDSDRNNQSSSDEELSRSFINLSITELLMNENKNNTECISTKNNDRTTVKKTLREQSQKSVVPFNLRSNNDKINITMNWITGKNTGRNKVKLNEIKKLTSKTLKDAVAEIDLNIVKHCFEKDSFQFLIKIIEKKKEKNHWTCGECGTDLNDASIQCDGCLFWHHISCANVDNPADVDWFCNKCLRK